MSNQTEESSKDVYVSESIKMLVMVIYCVVTILGLAGNTLTILSIFLNRKLKSIPNVYICNLAIADMIVCTVIAPFSAYVSMFGTRGVDPSVCTFIGALNAALLGKTIYGLTAIAVNRFILIVKGGHTYSKFYTRRNVIISVLILWTLPLLLIIPALAGFGKFGYNTMMGTCIFVSHDSMTYWYVQIVLHGVCVAPCVLVTLVCYTKIIIRFRSTQIQITLSEKGNRTSQRNSSKGETKEYLPTNDSAVEEYDYSSSGPSNNNSTTNYQTRGIKRAQASRRVVTNLCTVFSVFLMCWLPIVSVYTIDYHNRFPAAVSHIFYAIAVCNSCINVFIYAGMNTAFRRTYINILTCKFKKLNSAF